MAEAQSWEADLVVVGAGAAGLVAAVTAAEGGAKVIVFEKERSIGGTSNFFHGTFAVESEMQRERYITYSCDDAFRNIMEYSHWRANGRLVRAIVDESGLTIGWLQRHGVEFTEATINMPDSPRTYHVVKGSGAAMMKTLAEKAKEKGVDLRTEAPAMKILKAGNGVAGVVVERDGEEIRVPAKAVFIASGGYANSKEWIKKYAGFDLEVNVFPVGNVDKTGDGIRMAWEAGAAEEGMGMLELFSVGPWGPDFALRNSIEMVAGQPDLWVSPRGERFCDESVAFYDTSLGNAAARHREGYHYRLLDDSIKNIIVEKGIEKGLGVEYPPGWRPVNFDTEVAAALGRETKEAFVAGSVESLAGGIGVDPTVLKATVDEYNSFCEEGRDRLFAKPLKYLRPLKGPRFYAVKARTVFLGTMGGIKINHKMEVVDKKDTPIPGLYAGGYDAGGMWGDSYCIKCSSGLSSAFATNSGRIAGKNVLLYLGGAG